MKTTNRPDTDASEKANRQAKNMFTKAYFLLVAALFFCAYSACCAPTQAQTFWERNPDWKMQWREFKQNMPSKPEEPKLLEHLSDAGLIANVELLEVRRQSPRLRDGYQEIPFFVRIQGNYDNILRLFKGLAHREKMGLLNIRNLSLARTALPVQEHERALQADARKRQRKKKLSPRDLKHIRLMAYEQTRSHPGVPLEGSFHLIYLINSDHGDPSRLFLAPPPLKSHPAWQSLAPFFEAFKTRDSRNPFTPQAFEIFFPKESLDESEGAVYVSPENKKTKTSSKATGKTKYESYPMQSLPEDTWTQSHTDQKLLGEKALDERSRLAHELLDGGMATANTLKFLSYVLRRNPPTSEWQALNEADWNEYWNPENLWLNSLTINGDQVLIRGDAMGHRDVAEFSKRLETGIYFTQVEVHYTREALNPAFELNYVEFELRCTFNENSEGIPEN